MSTSALSTAAANSLLNHGLGSAAYAPVATLHFALFTADPGEAGVTGEVTGGSYARKAITNNTSLFPQSSLSGVPTKVNGTAINFATATAAWGTITHWAVYDSAVGGTNVMLAHGSLTTARYVASGDTPKIVAEAMNLTMSNAASGGLTNYSKRKLLDLMFGATAYTMPTSIRIALGTALSSESLTEWSDANYTRQAAVFSSATVGVSSNSGSLSFVGAGSAAGPVTLTSFGIADDVSAGNMLFLGPLSTSRVIETGDTVTTAVGAVVVTLQ